MPENERSTPRPPMHLSRSSKALWRRVVREWKLEAHEVRLLTLFCEALDRGEEARRAIAVDGAYLRDRFGQLKPHPALGIERDAAVRAARLARELRLDGEPDVDVRVPRLGRPSTPGGSW